jgi:hypothetical protein
MLDTCEDMVPDRQQRVAGLRWFATRFAESDLSEPAPSIDLVATSRQQEVDQLLFEKRSLVDQLYLRLPQADRDRVSVMVAAMASSMERWGAIFAAQGGVLRTDEQLDRYCDDVIGEPARFVSGLMIRSELTEPQLRQLSGVAEFIQLANITRDIERDLEGGVAYHPLLHPFLGGPAAKAAIPIRQVRRELLVRALRRAPSFTRLLDDLPLPRISAARGSGVVMLLFTDRYYRSCAVRAGLHPWKGSSSTLRILSSALLAVTSKRWTRRVGRRVEDRMLTAADLGCGREDPTQGRG